MRRLLLAFALLALVLMTGTGTALAVGHEGDDCNFVVAGKNATADGSVLMGYNNDWSAGNYSYLRVIPAPDSSKYQFVEFLTKGDWPEGGINDHQLAACYGVATDIAEVVEDADPYVDDGWGAEMWADILQNCSTASQAIDYFQQMANEKGFSGDAAGSFAFADENQAWVVEVIGGHHWVASRVPDNAFYEQPNMLRTRTIDLSKPNKFRGSADLEQFAISLSRYNPSSGPFDVAWAFGNRNKLQDPYNTHRLWGALHLAAASQSYDTSMPYDTRPVFVQPDHPLTRQSIADILRYHYEGTVLDLTDGYALLSPHLTSERTICYKTTDYSVVFQMRNWLPNAVGGIAWTALSRPCSSTYVPVYDSVTGVPAQWGKKTAYKDFRAVADSLDEDGTVDGVIRYKCYIPLVRGIYGLFESVAAAVQPCVESTACCLPASQRPAYLTDYTSQRAGQAQSLAQQLITLMP